MDASGLRLILKNGLCRAWHDRRVVATKDAIYFSRIGEEEGEEQVIDAIPMFEIEEIESQHLGESSQTMDDGLPLHKKSDVDKRVSTMARFHSIVGDSNKVKFRNSFQIWTQVDGYNSGRSYYLKAGSRDECLEVMQTLKNLARTSRALKDAKTRFEMWQERIRTVYHSAVIQSVVAAMIVAVLLLPQRHRPGALPCYSCRKTAKRRRADARSRARRVPTRVPSIGRNMMMR
jgi:hypothetical protein